MQATLDLFSFVNAAPTWARSRTRIVSPMHCLPFTKRIEGDYSCEVKGNDRIATRLKTDCRKSPNCSQKRSQIGQELQPGRKSGAIEILAVT
ncbi:MULTISPECIES: hypothetical protein [unclassified Mesorhizobium]|uniref:hypothetical protein n=1 Tax=unclassified Mesorhizobium TaxID=325217 RepID=UPI00241771DC|nr:MULTISPECIES: hypothetical protein [unclassified Mesorhizobium]MDG4901311.1 hypothetical protein [Mesorhizobium sp. WSM4962]MDG4916450.1 hypothetical protein [Mesorhizobium sp. WSM4989]